MANHDDNFDPLFHGIPHLEDSDFDKDGRLLRFRGKYVVVMVFATWCGPCKAYKPHHSKLHQMHKDDDNVVIAVINGSGKTSLDSEQNLMKRIDTIIPDFKGFPTIALFGPDGKFIGTHEGKRTTEDVKATIQKYME